ncbi:hypothetical protein [Frankia sp. CiP1_Cm_nod2]|uniref:hypothetical protein n=1 Tax=Frankia sp. CiP1_Cm_nod2 TaxID=2897161 RepID=UPI002024E181
MSEPLRSVLDAQVAVSRARAAARAGDLDRAARLLDGLDAAGRLDAAGAAGVPVLDLRARVHAQRGELAEADRCWARAQALVPDDPAAAAGRHTIKKISKGRRRVRPLVGPGRVVAAAVAVTAVTGTALGYFPLDGLGPRPPGVASPSERALVHAAQPRREDESTETLERRVHASEQYASALAGRLASLDAERAAAAGRRARDLDAIVEGLGTLSGASVERRAEDVRVVFSTGLFLRDAEISRTGRLLLTRIGGRLASMNVTTTVVGHVSAVAGGRTSGGSTVALDRARVAVGYLAAGGRLPLTAFALVSADQTQGPFPDVQRNRTVTLMIIPREPPAPR